MANTSKIQDNRFATQRVKLRAELSKDMSGVKSPKKVRQIGEKNVTIGKLKAPLAGGPGMSRSVAPTQHEPRITIKAVRLDMGTNIAM